ncbi:MAG TPA: aspartate aminotransferase family protein [Candidatus Peribacteraceae bacterium]|nr:aspartate aminotransferase family protein [Candidatus Peribacteraceae bacterium]
MERLSLRSAEGLWIKTQDDREILDAVSGTFNLPLGYFRKSIEAAVMAQINRSSFISSDIDLPVTNELTQKLIAVGEPFGLSSLFLRDLTGSTANECALKIAQAYTGRQGVLSFDNGHHGQTIASTGMSGNDFRKEGIPATRLPYSYRVPVGADILELENQWKKAKGDLAAVIVEPIQGNAGNVMHPTGYFSMLKEFCEDHDILLIIDEVQTGIGRVGENLASSAFNIEPDILTLAKGLGNGYPIAAVLLKPELDVLNKRYHHSFTSGTHPLSVAAANVTVEEVCNEPFLQSVRDKSIYLQELLTELQNQFPRVQNLRGMGFMWGIEIVDTDHKPDIRATNKIAETALYENNLRLRTSQYGLGNVIKIRPALIATNDELLEIVSRLKTTLQAVFETDS